MWLRQRFIITQPRMHMLALPLLLRDTPAPEPGLPPGEVGPVVCPCALTVDGIYTALTDRDPCVITGKRGQLDSGRARHAV